MDINLYKLYQATKSGAEDSFMELVKSNPNVDLQATLHHETILHFAAKYKQERIAERIVERQPSLLYKQNARGETALHIAADLGSSALIRVLLSGESQIGVEAAVMPSRMVNTEHETALHGAVRNGHLEVVKLLMEKDWELATFINKAGESPLFIAVDRRNVEIGRYILNKLHSSTDQLSGESLNRAFHGRKNMNALHAAIARRSRIGNKLDSNDAAYWDLLAKNLPLVQPLILYVFALTALLRTILYVRPPRIHIWQYIAGAATSVLSWLRRKPSRKDTRKSWSSFIVELTKNCPPAILEAADDFGWTPLHYAAYFGDSKTVKKLLFPNKFHLAYIQDKDGKTALHVATKEGHLDVLRELDNACPNIWELDDYKKNTVLHVAAKGGKDKVVKFILEHAPENLVNRRNSEGNTPLHLAIRSRGNNWVSKFLIQDGRADEAAVNNNGVSVWDIIHAERNYIFRKRSIIWPLYSRVRLSLEGVLHRIDKKSLDEVEQPGQIGTQEQARCASTAGGEEISSLNQLENIASSNFLVTTLIATVSFAAAFALPGGYINYGPEEGMATLSKKAAFKAFVIANTIAFCSSVASMNIHLLYSFMKRDYLSLVKMTSNAMGMTRFAIRAMVIAFLSGTYAVLDNSPGLAIAAISIGCFFAVLLGQI